MKITTGVEMILAGVSIEELKISPRMVPGLALSSLNFIGVGQLLCRLSRKE